MQENDYNKIFENLVTSDSPVGLIAYSLYKKHKREEIIKLTRNGRTLSRKDKKAIESVLSNQLDVFREQAHKLLDETVEALIEKNKAKIYTTYFKNQEFEEIISQIGLLNKKKPFLNRLGESLIFRVIWVIIIATISIIIYINSDELKLMGEKINETFKTEVQK